MSPAPGPRPSGRGFAVQVLNFTKVCGQRRVPQIPLSLIRPMSLMLNRREPRLPRAATPEGGQPLTDLASPDAASPRGSASHARFFRQMLTRTQRFAARSLRWQHPLVATHGSQGRPSLQGRSRKGISAARHQASVGRSTGAFHLLYRRERNHPIIAPHRALRR